MSKAYFYSAGQQWSTVNPNICRRLDGLPQWAVDAFRLGWQQQQMTKVRLRRLTLELMGKSVFGHKEG